MFVWAHRGASGEFPENTLLAFEQAIQQGADGIELDVIQVEDEFYIWHDRYLTTDGHLSSAKLVAKSSELLFCAQSKELINEIQLTKKQRIPTLSQALKLIAGRVSVNVELKQIIDMDLLIRTLCFAQQQYNFESRQLLISSFNHYLLEVLQHKSLLFPIGVLLSSSMNYFDTLMQQLKPFSIHFDVNCILKADIDKAHALGLKCFVYTVDRETDIKSLQNLGVDGVFTNFPDRSRKFL